MVRYELILHRAPKLRASDIEQRMGDLPDELSLGSLQRAIEDPELGDVPIAWGDSRKRLLMIQRRIAILSGDAELVDRAGPLRQRLTDWGDALLSPFRKDDAAAAHSGGSALGRIVWASAVCVAMAAGLLWRYGDNLPVPLPPWVRPRALQVAGFVAGVTLAQLLVSGLRLWMQGPGRRILASGCIVLALSSLAAASYQAREMGVWSRAGALKSRLTQDRRPQPNMKPFTALMVELERRHQRRELTAALDRSAPKTSPTEVATMQPNTPTAPTLETQLMAAQRPAEVILLAAVVPGTRDEARVAQPLSPKDRAREASERSSRSTHAQDGAAGVTASSKAVDRADSRMQPAKPAPGIVQPDDALGPWRTLYDIHPIHAAFAAALAFFAFALGVWMGRRERMPSSGVAPSTQAERVASERPTPARVSQPTADSAVAQRAAAAKSLTEEESFPPLPTAQLGSAAQQAAANDTSAAIAAASAQRLAAEALRPGRRAVATPTFEVQEARVAPRKRDARSDD